MYIAMGKGELVFFGRWYVRQIGIGASDHKPTVDSGNSRQLESGLTATG